MPTCFVIQPFRDKFDKRYEDVYRPALEEAGLEPYRVDQDPSTERLIDSIEEQIRNATICLADITTDNPNVWYELGHAFAVGRSVIMVCSNERNGKLPFDIQHRTVIPYQSESASDFDRLRTEISTRAKALVEKNAARQVIEAQHVAPTGGVRQAEILVLAVVAAEAAMPGTSISDWSLRREAERAGLTGIGLAVAIRGLGRKGFVEFGSEEDESGERYQTVAVTEIAWNWIDSNDSAFSLFKEKSKGDDGEDSAGLSDDDIPF